MISGTGILESPALRQVRPASPLYGRDGSLLHGGRRAGKGAEAAAASPDRGLPTDATGLSRSGEEIGRSLEHQQRQQSARAQEQAYIATGRAARHEDVAAFSGMAVILQAGNPAAAHTGASLAEQFGSGAQSARVQPDDAPEENSRTERPAEESDSPDGQNSGGMEARSAERSFVGGLSKGADRYGHQAREKAGAAGQNGEDDSETGSGLAELTEAEQAEVEELKKRDQEVRAHEQAHLSAAGGLASGGASYQRTRGPDGNMYAVGGEVQIDTSEASTPEATITKARQIKSAALAPAQPSAQDRQVAAQASQMEAAARQEKTSTAADEAEKTDGPANGSQVRGADAAGAEDGGARVLQDIHLTRRADKAYASASRDRYPRSGGGVLRFAV